MRSSGSIKLKPPSKQQLKKQLVKKAEAKRLAQKRSAQQRKQDEHKRKLQHSREVADRVLAEIGALAETQGIKRDHVDGKFPRSALFVNYDESGAKLTLAWGHAFELKRQGDGNKEFDYEPQSGDYPPTKDYFYFTVGVNTSSEIRINGEPTVEIDIPKTLAKAFVNPLHELNRYSSFPGYGSPHGAGGIGSPPGDNN